MKWNDLYERAIDKGYGDKELRAKDEARGQICEIAKAMKIDLEAEEIPEDAIENFCNIHKAEFDEDGNISAFHPLKWNDLDDNVKSILEWISHPFTGEKGIVNIKAGEDFYRNYKEFLTIGYAFYDTGEVRIPVTNEIYNTILDYVSGDKGLSLVVDEDSQTAYFGFKSIMKNFSITKDDKIPDNEIDLEI